MSVESTVTKIRDVQSELAAFDEADLKQIRDDLAFPAMFGLTGRGTDASTGDTPHILVVKGPDV